MYSAILAITIVLIILLAIGLGVFIVFIMSKGYTDQLDDIKSDIKDLDIENMDSRIENLRVSSYRENVMKKDEIDALSNSVNDTITRHYNPLMIEIQDLETELKKFWTVPFIGAQDKLDSISEQAVQFKLDFLESSFKFSQLNFYNELKLTLILKLQRLYKIYKIKIQNTEKNILKSFPNIKISKVDIENRITNLVSNESKMDMNQFKVEIVSVMDRIKTFSYEVDILISAYDNFESVFQKRVDKIFSLFAANEKALASKRGEYKIKYEKIRLQTKKLKSYLVKEDVEGVKRQVSTVSNLLTEIEIDIALNIKALQLFVKSEPVVKKIIATFDFKLNELLHEIERHNLDSEETDMTNSLIRDKETVKSAWNEYDTIKRSTLNKVSPWDIMSAQSKLIEVYASHLENITGIVSSIRNIIDITDGVNREIAKANVALLSAENILRKLPKSAAVRYLKKINKYQKLTSELIEIFRGRLDPISDHQKKVVRGITVKSEQILSQVKRDELISDVLKRVIVRLNLEATKNKKMKNDVRQIKILYKEAEFAEALTLTAHTLKRYRIK